MRILQVNKFVYRKGGAEAYMLDVADLQRRRGHEIAFYGMAHPDNLDVDHAAHFAPHLSFDPPEPGPTGRVRVAARMLWSRSARRGIDAVIEAFRPDVAHLHNVYHQLSPSILGPLRRHGVPTVMTLHDYKLVCPTYQLLDHGRICEACIGNTFAPAVRRRCNRGSLAGSALVAAESTLHHGLGLWGRVDRFICPSAFLAAKLAEGGVYPDRLRHVEHFMDLASVAAAETPGAGVVVAGRLSHEKGIDVAVRAVAGRPGLTLTVAGDGPARAELVALAAELAPDRIRFTGRLAKDELHDLLRASAVLAVPSRWYENQPMIVLESFACGTPVVASGLGGLTELIRPGVDGELVPADDASALGAALSAVAADPAAARRMGLAGRSLAVERFEPERHLDRLESVYAEAAAR